MLKRQILNRIKQRDNGETVMNLFPIVISSIVLLALVIIFTTWIANVDKKESVDQIVRKYTLKLETVGYLDDTAQNQLIDELKNAGMINPQCTAPVVKNGVEYRTTTVAQSYGYPVYLVITGEIPLNDPQLVSGEETHSGLVNIIRGTDNARYSVVKMSISKTTADY